MTCLHFLNGVFQREDLNFDESNLSIFSCTGHDFDVVVKNSALPNPKSLKFPYMSFKQLFGFTLDVLSILG